MKKYFDKSTSQALEKEDAVYQALFGLIDISGNGQFEKIEAKLEVLIDLCVKNEAQRVKSAKDLDKLAGYKRFTEVE